MLILIQGIQFGHLSLAQLEIEDVTVGDDAFLGIGFG
jgi:hypothetical protein